MLADANLHKEYQVHIILRFWDAPLAAPSRSMEEYMQLLFAWMLLVQSVSINMIVGMSNRAKGGADCLYFDVSRVYTGCTMLIMWLLIVLLCPTMVIGLSRCFCTSPCVFADFDVRAWQRVVFMLKQPHDLYCCASFIYIYIYIVHDSYATTTPTGRDGPGNVRLDRTDVWRLALGRKRDWRRSNRRSCRGMSRCQREILSQGWERLLSLYMLRSVPLFCFFPAGNATGGILRDSRLCSW